jgi:hypothetical protein
MLNDIAARDPDDRHSSAWRQPSRITHPPIGPISPRSSASGKPAGGTMPLAVLPAHERFEGEDVRFETLGHSPPSGSSPSFTIGW